MDDLLYYVRGNGLEALVILRACEEERGREPGEGELHTQWKAGVQDKAPLSSSSGSATYLIS